MSTKATKYGNIEDITAAARLYIDNIKRKSAIEAGGKVGCPSVIQSLGTKIRIKQYRDGKTKINCEGLKEHEICQKCPIHVSRERA